MVSDDKDQQCPVEMSNQADQKSRSFVSGPVFVQKKIEIIHRY
jgi:hypothetical protein